MTMRRRLKLQAEPIRRPMIGIKSRLLTIFAVLSILALGGCQNQTATDKSAEKEKAKTEKPASGMPGMMITKVSVITPSVRTVPITMTAAGTLASPNAVTLTPQVSGTIDAVHVQSGQQVEKGDLLFSLDAQPFETALLSARAKLEGDRAQARYAAQQVQQLKPLVEKEYVTRQSYDQAVATAMAANALIAQDEAAIQTAQINLAYTKIRAPITGRLGEISLQPGNLVVANNTALSTLVSNRELLVNFSLPQSVLQALREEWPGLGQTKPGEKSVPPPTVEILDEHADLVLGKGHLSFIDNSISAGTGTIRLQGLIDNRDGSLWPGQFVTARLTLGQIPDAQVLPAAAVQIGDQGMFVYLYKNGKVEMQTVSPARNTSNEAALPAGSLPADAKVIYPLPARIAPGMAVALEKTSNKKGQSSEQLKAEPASHPGSSSNE
ncbi:efflux RND transporter periplasmic adaptor subunit [Halothiobacillus sp.]|uniref:efflux RND transporter periplasmic adaptor subunit n=1 Tax=Halothiobacillus sp. TaxID=1891311 RepID=UPI0026276844|nr:efflux RND transporter periplasmic adaptor subunit [Halothiobacillus sp.]